MSEKKAGVFSAVITKQEVRGSVQRLSYFKSLYSDLWNYWINRKATFSCQTGLNLNYFCWFESVAKDNCIFESMYRSSTTLKATGKFVKTRNLKTSGFIAGQFIICYTWQDGIANPFVLQTQLTGCEQVNKDEKSQLVQLLVKRLKLFSNSMSFW